MAHDVLSTSVTIAGLVYDVTDPDYWENDGSGYDRVSRLLIRRRTATTTRTTTTITVTTIIITEICKAPTLRLKALNKRTHIIDIEMENAISNKNCI